MLLNIIHDPLRTDRHTLLMLEAAQQGFAYKLWDAVKGGKPKENISKAHRTIVQHAKDNNFESILIGEDDMKWCGKGSFDYFISKIPNDYDVFLAGIEWGRLQGDGTVDDFAGLNCYIIHQRFYDTFLSIDTTKDIDRALARKGKFVVVNPFCVIQQETISDNSRRRIHSNAKLYFNRTLYNGTNGQ